MTTESDISDVLKYCGWMGHPFVVVEPYDENGSRWWRTAFHTATIESARRYARERTGSRIYGRTKQLPGGYVAWERYPKRQPKSN